MELCDVPVPVIKAGCVAANGADTVATSALGGALDAAGDGFARAASVVLDAVFALISQTSSPNLSAAYVTRNASLMAAVALVVVIGLFVIQVVIAALRQEPGGLLRAVTGAGVALLGAAVAATITQTLIVAVDALCEGIAATAGTSIEDAAHKLLDVSVLLQLSGTGGGAALMIVFGLLFVVGALLLLGTLLVRNALLVVSVVLAPLAFAGGTSRLTSGWVRRWIQLTLALILSKLAVVVVFVVAVGMVGDSAGLGGLLSGLILLFAACLAPWACFRFLDFAGTHIAREVHASTSGPTLASIHQGRVAATSMMRTAAPIIGGPPAAAAMATRAGISTAPPVGPAQISVQATRLNGSPPKPTTEPQKTPQEARDDHR